VDYKATLTGSYAVLLTVGDINATDDLGLGQYCFGGGLTCTELTSDMVRCGN